MHAIASDQASAPGGHGVAPASLVHVYTPGGLALLALAGWAIAIVLAPGQELRAGARPVLRRPLELRHFSCS